MRKDELIMEFPNAHVKSVKADLTQGGDISLNFRLAFNNDNLEAAQRLALLVGEDNDSGLLTFIPNQFALFPGKVELKTFSNVNQQTGEIKDFQAEQS
jgi:hypothetical protein